MRGKFVAQGNNWSLWWGSNPQLTDYESDTIPTAPGGPYNCTVLEDSVLQYNLKLLLNVTEMNIAASIGDRGFWKQLVTQYKA